MNVRGERIIVFGDSLSHAGPDAGPTVVDLTATQIQTSAPGEALGRSLLAAGAQAVRVDAKVGRSARSFLLNEDASSLLASDRTFRPTKVVVFLGTNDIDRGLTSAALAATRDAMTQIRDAYRAMGAEVFAIGPPAFQDPRYNASAPIMLDLMRGVFGVDHTLDARPLTDPGPRARDGVHFAASTAAGTARRLFGALTAPPTIAVTTPRESSDAKKFFIGFGVVASIAGLGWLILRVARRVGERPGLGDFAAYYNIDPKNPISIAEVGKRWAKKGDKAYDPEKPWVFWYPIDEVMPYREYYWRREDARLSPEEWDEMKSDMRTAGWTAGPKARAKNPPGTIDPAYVIVGRNGYVKVGEGNHRLAIARELGLKLVPIRFQFYEKVEPFPQSPEAHAVKIPLDGKRRRRRSAA